MSFLELFLLFTKIIKLDFFPFSSFSRFCFYELGLMLFRPALNCWLQLSLHVSASCIAGPTGTCHHAGLRFAFKSNLRISHESYQNFFKRAP